MAYLPHLPVTSASCSFADHECVSVVNELALCVNPCRLSPKFGWQSWLTNWQDTTIESEGELSRVLVASTFTVPRCTMEVSCVAESGGSLALFARIFSSFQDRAQCVLQELGHVGPLMSLLC